MIAVACALRALRGPVEIVLISCETGWGGAPYALNLKVDLVQAHKIVCSVSAPKRFVTLNPDASQRVAELTFDDAGNITSATDVPAPKAFYATTKAF
jgi:hypothetical protein